MVRYIFQSPYFVRIEKHLSADRQAHHDEERCFATKHDEERSIILLVSHVLSM
jgi:hypothetical protein